jgi:hypothetical protein
MPVSKLAIWNGLWIVAVAALCLGGFIVAQSFRERVKIIDADLTAGQTAYFDVAPYRVAGQGAFMARQPVRVRRVEHWRGKSLDLYDITTYSAHPMTDIELQSDISAWQHTPGVKFERAALTFGARSTELPDWFPTPSEATYVGSLNTSHGWTVSLYHRPNEDVVYAVF